MLVLARKLGEKIRIGDDVWITVVDIDGGKVRLGVEAPKSVPIYRQELLPRIAAEQAAAAVEQSTATQRAVAGKA